MYLGYLQRDRQRSLNTKYSMLRMVVNPLTSRPECMPGSRYTGVGVLFFVI